VSKCSFKEIQAASRRHKQLQGDTSSFKVTQAASRRHLQAERQLNAAQASKGISTPAKAALVDEGSEMQTSIGVGVAGVAVTSVAVSGVSMHSKTKAA
jgi:hypothetical protein